MNNKQVIAIGMAIILIFGGVGAFFIINSANNSEPKEKEFVEYDSSKGWASWNPTVFKFSSSLMGGSPFVVNTAEEMYRGIYGNLPTNTGITIDDVPSDFYKHNSLVSYNSDGKLVVKSFAVGPSGTYEPRDVVFNGIADYNMGAGSFVATLYYVMSYAKNIDPNKHDSTVVSDMWNKVNAGTFSTYDDLYINYGIPVEGFKGYKMPQMSASDILGSSEDYVKVIESVASEGKSTVYFGYGSMNSWSNGGTWLTDLAESQGSYVILGQFATVNEALALVEAMAHIYGMKEVADSIIDDIRLRLYTLSVISEEKMEALPYQLSGVGTYANSEWTFGPTSIAADLFSLMSVRNIKTDPSGNWSEENVIAEQPEIIILTGNQSTLDTIDMDIALRVHK